MTQTLESHPGESPLRDRVARILSGEEHSPVANLGGFSDGERELRERMEERKTHLLGEARRPGSSVFLNDEIVARARRNIASQEKAQAWMERQRQMAEQVLSGGDRFIEDMISMTTPGNPYFFTCPACVGRESQEGAGITLVEYKSEDPFRFYCRACGQAYPDAEYPEEQVLKCPRTGHELTYYLRPGEEACDMDSEFKRAWKYYGIWPLRVSFSGILRNYQVRHMISACTSMAWVAAIDARPEFHEPLRKTLLRFADCYRHWMYHDSTEAYADCDPLYAAWHADELELEWKRHPFYAGYLGKLGNAYHTPDTLERASMNGDYWLCGRIHPSTDWMYQTLTPLVLAYDYLQHVDGVLSSKEAEKVERDLLLEFVFGAEPYLGGEFSCERINNKMPRILAPMATLGLTLGIDAYANTALDGYRKIVAEVFAEDGFSDESPGYNEMYLHTLLDIPYVLNHSKDSELALNTSDRKKLEQILFAARGSLRDNLCFLPLSDTLAGRRQGLHTFETAAVLVGGEALGLCAELMKDQELSEFSVFHLDLMDLKTEMSFQPPELVYPDWKTAVLRDGRGHTATLVANPAGKHRHRDHLAITFEAKGRQILGDLGYVGDTAHVPWGQSTLSHNTVVVDGQEQVSAFEKRESRQTRGLFSSSVSWCEFESEAYPSCSLYRRGLVMLKGQDSSCLVDLFRVHGEGQKAFRVQSEVGTSDEVGADFQIEGEIEHLEDSAPPSHGTSMDPSDIFGLKKAQDWQGTGAWRATWSDDKGRYRLHQIAGAQGVELHHGPAQENHDQHGRRARYLDAINRDQQALFVHAHEYIETNEEFLLSEVSTIGLPQEAGAEALAVKFSFESREVLLLDRITQEVEVDGVRFAGECAVVIFEEGRAREVLAHGASRLLIEDWIDVRTRPEWSAPIAKTDECGIHSEEDPPEDWLFANSGASTGIQILGEENVKSFTCHECSGRKLRLMPFQASKGSRFSLFNLLHHQRD